MIALHLSEAPPSTRLSIYLGDHLAASEAGRHLATRALLNNRSTSYEAGLRRFVHEIDQELAALRTIMRHQQVRMPLLKPTAAVVGERVGRWKFNGQLRGYSPLSRVLEFEGLTAGVQAKRLLWQSLRTFAGSPSGGLPEEVDLDHLEAQAEAQLAWLKDVHGQAATEAFIGT